MTLTLQRALERGKARKERYERQRLHPIVSIPSVWPYYKWPADTGWTISTTHPEWRITLPSENGEVVC